MPGDVSDPAALERLCTRIRQDRGRLDVVFANAGAGDAFRQIKKLRRLRVWIMGVAGADSATCARRGYDHAFQTQIAHGIFGYCGAEVAATALLHETSTEAAAAHVQRSCAMGLQAGASHASPAAAQGAGSPARRD